jgi:hypothetical protein
MLEEFILGATVMAMAVAGVFFLRYWRDSGDRLFLIFAIAFWLLGIARFSLAWLGPTVSEPHTYFYLLRLAAFVLILLAILDKNLRKSRQLQPSLERRTVAVSAHPSGRSRV